MTKAHIAPYVNTFSLLQKHIHTHTHLLHMYVKRVHTVNSTLCTPRLLSVTWPLCLCRTKQIHFLPCNSSLNTLPLAAHKHLVWGGGVFFNFGVFFQLQRLKNSKSSKCWSSAFQVLKQQIVVSILNDFFCLSHAYWKSASWKTQIHIPCPGVGVTPHNLGKTLSFNIIHRCFE